MLASIFKSYDIRGLSPQEIDAVGAERLGEALVQLYRPKRVLIGRDMRATSLELERALIEGLTDRGVQVTRIGLCSTPLFYFAVGEKMGHYDLGVMITASHNPAQYNGFKLVKGDCQPIGQGSGMEEIRDWACDEKSESRIGNRESGIEQVEEDFGVKHRYLERVFRLAALPAELPTWKIAIDAGNGMNGFLLPDFVKRLPSFSVEPLYWELDGSFPHHEANPLNLETLWDLQNRVKETKCVFGVAFDGDGDRVGFVDEEGTPIPGDILTALFAREILREKKSRRILYDLRSSWTVSEIIRAHGGDPGMCRVGHAHIKRQMKKEGAAFAGELSMHFYFEDFHYAESSDYAFLLLVKILLREQKPLSCLWRPLQTYTHSGERNFQVKDVQATLERLDRLYSHRASERSTLDGLRFEFRDSFVPEHDWWFNVRASNTEPVLRLNLEAHTTTEMEKRLSEVTASFTD